jgi:uncharacterized cofD-like protein
MREKIRNIFKWLYPGIGIKRWIGLSTLGVVLLVFSTAHLRTADFWFIQILDAIDILSGIIILILGVKRLFRSFISAVVPTSKSDTLVDILYQRKQLGRGPKIVTIGGGTGLSVLLNGLKQGTSNITAIVTVADDGGSSGRIRQQFDILPPGDIRNCLVALADAPILMRDLFQFRFDASSDLSGHSFGNLFLTAMTRLTGDFEKAIKEASKVLALRGQVIPSTLNNVVLVAQYQDGSTTVGEAAIPKTHKPINRVSLRPADSLPTPDALKAIREAQLIVLGPGSLFTSIIPNFLIKEIADTVASSGAIKVYVCNVMTQPGETDGYTASDHLKALISHSHPRVLDYCIVNTGEIPQEMLQRYQREGAYSVVCDRRKIENMGYRVIEDNFVVTDDLIRHDADRLAKIILGLLEEV